MAHSTLDIGGSLMTTKNVALRSLARWVMRFEAAGDVLRIGLFGGTFLTTGVSALAQYGYGHLALPFAAIIVLGTIAFAYAYERAGVYNQKNRDKVDAGDNYSGPTMLMDARIEARQLAYLGYALQNGGAESPEELYEEFREVTDDEWAAMRDGLNIQKLEQ